MTSDSPKSHDTQPHAAETPSTLQDAIRARALNTLARDESARKRSPRQIVIATLLMLVAVGAFLFVIDLSVRTMHHIMELWFPAKTQVQPDVRQPYPVIVESSTPVEQAPNQPSSAHSASSGTNNK